jgi:hypothetical protein
MFRAWADLEKAKGRPEEELLWGACVEALGIVEQRDGGQYLNFNKLKDIADPELRQAVIGAAWKAQEEGLAPARAVFKRGGQRMPRGGARPGAGRPVGGKDRHPRISAERIGRSHREVLDALAGIERKLGTDLHAGQLGEIEMLIRDNVLRRLVAIERALGLVEQPKTPRIGRRRPLE